MGLKNVRNWDDLYLNTEQAHNEFMGGYDNFSTKENLDMAVDEVVYNLSPNSLVNLIKSIDDWDWNDTQKEDLLDAIRGAIGTVVWDWLIDIDMND